MSDELYRVVFTGRLVEGVSGKQALENLSQLFKKTPDQIRKVFSKPGTVVRSNLPLLTAEKMLAGLTRSGALCRLQPMSAEAVAAPEPDNSHPVMLTGSAPQVFALQAVQADLTLDPISCGRITSHPAGLETSRLDRSFIAFTDILAATVYTLTEGSNDLNLVLFTAGHKRPLLIEGMHIAFGEFPDVPGQNLPTSLRNFLNFIVAQNPDICADEKTAAYMGGGAALVWSDEPLLLSTQVNASLVQAEIELGRKPLNAPAPGTVVEPKPSARPAPQPVREEIQPESPAPVREIDLRAEIEGWVDRWPLPLAIALMIGFLLPLLKKSLLFDSIHLIWFWNLLGFGLDGSQIAAMATYSSGQWNEVYLLLPLISAFLLFITLFAIPKRWRGLVMFVAGSVPLSLAFTLFWSGGEIYCLIFLPVTAAGGGLMLALLIAALLVATVNHLSKHSIVHLHLRLLQALGSLVLLLLTILAFIAPDWNNFALYLLYTVWLVIALLSIKGVIKGANDETSQVLISLLFRIALLLTPIAVIVAQSAYDNPFVTFVVESGGGVVPLVVSCLKAFLIYYSMAIAFGVGMVQMLGRRYAGRSTGCDPKKNY
jgi:hypothetical protein